MRIKDINSCENKYGIIYSDPPWQQKRGGRKAVRPNSSGINLDYPTMDLQAIEDLHRRVLEKNTDAYHNIFMWTIDKYLRDAEDMLERLGYVRHARIIWDKVTGIPSAFTIRYSHEYLLWFYKKNYLLKPAEYARGLYSDVIREKVRKHSQKPESAYKLIENMFPYSTKLELFARNSREGWDCWGDEAPESP